MRIGRNEIIIFSGLTCYWPLSAKSWNDQLWIRSVDEPTDVWGVFSLFVAAAVLAAVFSFVLRRSIERRSYLCQRVLFVTTISLCAVNCLLAYADLYGGIALFALAFDAVVLGFVFVLLSVLWGLAVISLQPSRVLFLAFASTAASTMFTLVASAFEPLGVLMAALLPFISCVFLIVCRIDYAHATAIDSGRSLSFPWGFVLLVVLSDYVFALLYGLTPIEYAFSVNYTWVVSGICSIALSLLAASVLLNQPSFHVALLKVWIVLSLALILSMFIAVILPVQFIDLVKSLILGGENCIGVYLWGALVVLCQRSDVSLVAVMSGLFVALLSLSGCVANYLGPFLVSAFPALGKFYFAPVAALLTLLIVLALLVPLARLALRASDEMASETQRGSDGGTQWLIDEFGLTSREADVAELLARGHSTQKVSDELRISPYTVKTHTKSIYRKMGVRKRQELIDIVEHRVSG